EPLTPGGNEPFSFAVGRLFHDDRSVVPLMVARRRLLAEARGPRRVLIASNPGGGLPLLETFSRNTAKEFANAGYETKALFRDAVTKDEVRGALPGQDVFLWEGHHSTLIREFKVPDWDEPAVPSFVFLQSCLALTEEKAQPLLRRGAVGVVGSPVRTYSASGGACSLAFFDALLYDDRSLGGGLRQAKNFLLAYAQLKDKRLGKDAKRTGANLRAAWAFTLWGDPTLTLPRPERPAGALPGVRHEVQGNTIVVSLPEKRHDKVESSKFQVEMPPNARLAGLIRKEGKEDEKPLVPFVFVEVALPKAPAGHVPELRAKVPASHYVFTWDERRRTGYLLLTPRPRDENELRFHVSWKKPDDGGAVGE
ncbi:MAG TPA: C25 family cysteine peptidase, partial [Gemmataceae bacterium]|nr:C25 family cysteine peptidase [Gemmataceae bacterium]